MRQIIAEASELLKDRRRERSATVEMPDLLLPTETDEFVYDIRTSYFPRIDGHFPAIFRMEKHEGTFVAVPLEARVCGKERPAVIAREIAKNGEVFKIVRESGEFSYQVPFSGRIYNLKQFGNLCDIGLPEVEALRHFLEAVELEVFEKINEHAGGRLEWAKRNLEESRDRLERWRLKQFRGDETPSNKREYREMLKSEQDDFEQGPTRIVQLQAFVEWLKSVDRSNPTLTSIPSPPPKRSSKR